MMDNLNTHDEGSLIERFGKEKAMRLMERIAFHHTPKHASWLNMAEIELSILSRQALGRIGAPSCSRKGSLSGRKSAVERMRPSTGHLPLMMRDGYSAINQRN